MRICYNYPKMFVRKWTSRRADGSSCIYLGLACTYRQGGKVYQQHLCHLGRLDQLVEKGKIDRLIQGLARFSQKRWVIADEAPSGRTPEEQ